MHHYILVMDNEDTVLSMRYQANQESTSRLQEVKRKYTYFHCAKNKLLVQK